MFREAAPHLGLSPAETTFAVQGFGNVGSWAARIMQQLGCRMVAVSDAHQGTTWSALWDSATRYAHFMIDDLGLKPGDQWCLCASRWGYAHALKFNPDRRPTTIFVAPVPPVRRRAELALAETRRNSRRKSGGQGPISCL